MDFQALSPVIENLLAVAAIVLVMRWLLPRWRKRGGDGSWGGGGHPGGGNCGGGHGGGERGSCGGH